MGEALLMFGLILQSPDGLVAAKLLMIFFFLTITSPSSCHALAKSALTQGLKPELDQPPKKKK